MSSKAEKGSGQSKKDKASTWLRTRPEELPEIHHTDWRVYDDKLGSLKEFLRANTQDLESICPDQMLLMLKPATYETG